MEVSPYLHGHSVFSPWNTCLSTWVTKDCKLAYDTGYDSPKNCSCISFIQK